MSRELRLRNGEHTLRELNGGTDHEREDVVRDSVGVGGEREQACSDCVCRLLPAADEHILDRVDDTSYG